MARHLSKSPKSSLRGGQMGMEFGQVGVEFKCSHFISISRGL